MAEKLIAEMTLRLSLDKKQKLILLAERLGMDGASELVRMLIDSYLDKSEQEYASLHSIFGKSPPDS